MSDGIGVFLRELKNLHSVPHVARDARETVDLLRGIISECDPKSVVGAGLPPPARMLVETALKGVRHAFVEDLKGQDALDVISRAEIGITWAQLAAAAQGCIFEVVYDDAVKLASSLPRVHVAMLSSKDLVSKLSEALIRVSALLRDGSQRERKPVVSIISGPSKTADIEMRLVYGVHGPHTLHVMLLDWL